MSHSESRNVFLTGGARGIGAAIAHELGGKGWTIFAPSRMELDLCDPESVGAYLHSYAPQEVDILINNAGINILNALPDIALSDWHRMQQTNLTSALQLTQFFAPQMAVRGWGRILNVSSIFSLVTKESRAAYSMTKAALNALTRSAAVEFGPRGVLVNSLAPGYVDTELTRQNNSAEAIRAIESTIPLRRMAQPAEMARIAAFLVSEENTYLTGQTITVDGGFTCQ
jgi:3-oxoacyl-[acyl-carrier protein] reductase